MMTTLMTEVLASGFWRLKGPRWHLGALWVSDSRAGPVFIIDLDGNVSIAADVPSRPSGLGFLPEGDLLVASMTQRKILKFRAGTPALHADLSEVAAGMLRDLAVARDGNAYVTSFDARATGPDTFASARILLASPDGSVRSVAEGLAHPTGLAITSAHDLVVAETLGSRLISFQIGADGALLHRKVFANFERMSPLGICADSEGAVWAAAAHQPFFVRVLPGGRITHRVEVPGRHAVACQLGGSDGRTLFCLTVSADLASFPDREHTANVETTRVAVPCAGASIRLAEAGFH